MGEFEDWVKQKETLEAQLRAVAANAPKHDAAEAERRLLAERTQEIISKCKPTADRVQSVFEEVMSGRPEFMNARHHTITQELVVSSRPYNWTDRSHIAVTALWGEKLNPTPQEKELIAGKHQLFRPASIVDHDYFKFTCEVGTDYLKNVYVDNSKVLNKKFLDDKTLIYGWLHDVLSSRTRDIETWVKSGHGYMIPEPIQDVPDEPPYLG